MSMRRGAGYSNVICNSQPGSLVGWLANDSWTYVAFWRPSSPQGPLATPFIKESECGWHDTTQPTLHSDNPQAACVFLS
ncbi:hypothetical protein PanWU01x14_197780 [Parasponia andersonii]|uniref:Uncharacterized protein n=1 Tax=Parasponia andersonii TaxID=3476 RepID=A0A2P5BZ18_PARAD|nr:hypothetical protein PanWU01x14_197780 [Parasponia andersonii]